MNESNLNADFRVLACRGRMRKQATKAKSRNSPIAAKDDDKQACETLSEKRRTPSAVYLFGL